VAIPDEPKVILKGCAATLGINGSVTRYPLDEGATTKDLSKSCAKILGGEREVERENQRSIVGSAAGAMLFDHASKSRGVENTGVPSFLGKQCIVDEVAQILSQPTLRFAMFVETGDVERAKDSPRKA